MMGCNCSHNGITVALPDWVDTGKQNRTVSIDECIVPVIKALWDERFETLGCCCGHGKEAPGVVIASSYGVHDVRWIKKVVRTMDDRKWDIYQWKLVKV